MTTLNLEQFRRRAGVSLEGISDRTKISTRFLRAIESEEFLKLPGGVFNTSYIRQYAVEIGYPEQDLLSHYAARMHELQPEDVLIARVRTEPKPPSAWKSWLEWLLGPSATAQERT